MSGKTDLVIFGAGGDLARRKLFPALYQLDRAELLDSSVRIAAVARGELTTPDFLEQTELLLKEAVGDNWDKQVWKRFSQRLQYLRIDFSFRQQF